MKRTFFLACVVIGASLPAHAQSSSMSVEIGTARTRYADSIDATAVSISPAIRAAGTNASISASGTLSQLSGASSNSGLVDASIFTGTWRSLSAEIEGLAGGSAHSDGARTGQLLGSGRLHVIPGGYGMWAGAGLGRTWDGAWRGVVQGDLGAWVAGTPGVASLSVSPTVVDDTIKYTDTFVSLHRVMATWDLSASFGARAGQQVPTLQANHTTWGSLAATFWAKPTIGLVASVGTYPVDFTQGFPGGRFLSLGLRFGTNRKLERSAGVVATPPAEGPGAAAAVAAFEVTRLEGGAYGMRVRARSARRVEVTGDFSEWAPVGLQDQGGGWWTVTVPLSRGAHEVNVRVDGGAWMVPPGLLSATDEFGGSVGRFVIP
jgi:hypothetical protein